MIDLDKYAGHTAGPWGYRGSLGPQSNPHLKGPHIVEADNGTQIAIMSGWRSDCSEANARLIADAPALLAEVVRLRQDLHDTIRESQQYRAERDEAVEALRELSHYAETSDDCQYGALSTRIVRDIANPFLTKHGDDK